MEDVMRKEGNCLIPEYCLSLFCISYCGWKQISGIWGWIWGPNLGHHLQLIFFLKLEMLEVQSQIFCIQNMSCSWKLHWKPMRFLFISRSNIWVVKCHIISLFKGNGLFFRAGISPEDLNRASKRHFDLMKLLLLKAHLQSEALKGSRVLLWSIRSERLSCLHPDAERDYPAQIATTVHDPLWTDLIPKIGQHDERIINKWQRALSDCKENMNNV